jgi:hypothetical protein
VSTVYTYTVQPDEQCCGVGLFFFGSESGSYCSDLFPNYDQEFGLWSVVFQKRWNCRTIYGGLEPSSIRAVECRLCSLAGRYDNPIPTRFLAPIDCSKIRALHLTSKARHFMSLSTHRKKIIPATVVILFVVSLHSLYTCVPGS